MIGLGAVLAGQELNPVLPRTEHHQDGSKKMSLNQMTMMQHQRIIYVGGGSHPVPYQPAELYVVASGTCDICSDIASDNHLTLQNTGSNRSRDAGNLSHSIRRTPAVLTHRSSDNASDIHQDIRRNNPGTGEEYQDESPPPLSRPLV